MPKYFKPGSHEYSLSLPQQEFDDYLCFTVSHLHYNPLVIKRKCLCFQDRG